ncbi:hypothetical protein C5167_010478 [Papaver somniferum]|uniref:Methyltransferase type 11 domain-containing protein n=1 Tax=Papaver somniferum TaxID=3469 RepID=A0A4Y7K4A9_PAPSO|nr:hypothetical protein C5167_010478 [Papaver somniferum]
MSSPKTLKSSNTEKKKGPKLLISLVFANDLLMLVVIWCIVGLATAKSISVQAGKDSGVVLATIKTNKQKYHSALVHKNVMELGNIPLLVENLSERVLELLALPGDDVPRVLLDIGCGSRLSGETSSESGHQWIDVALEREVDGDLLLSDMGQDLGFMDGVINGAISISAVQFLMGGGGSFSAGGPGKGCTHASTLDTDLFRVHASTEYRECQLCIPAPLSTRVGVLRPAELNELFSTPPESPWSKAPHKESAEKTALGE